MPRPTNAYAPTARFWDGVQSQYTGGLTYFPDNMTTAMPLGDVDLYDAAAGTVGGAIAGPVGATVGVQVSNVVQRWFGGNAVDQARQERVNYVAQAAVNNNVNAMRIILGGPDNVSGNEREMWITAYNLIKRENPDVVRAAEAIGPYWQVGSGDTATNYPRLKEWVRAGEGAAQRIANTVTDFFSPSSAPSPGGVAPSSPLGQSMHAGMSPLVIAGIAGAAFLLLSRKRRS